MSTREAAKAFLSSGVLPGRLTPEVERLHRLVAASRTSIAAEIVLIVIAYVLAALTIGPELCPIPQLCVANADTWHSYETDAGAIRLTLTGAYAMLVALPILNYWWLRWAWKIIIWVRYLYGISRYRLMLVASHPDRTGGIGFISRAQARFAWIIFAYGISNVAAVIAYKITIEGADMTVMAVWGPALGFTIGAPLLFTLPLFMFTKQLFRTKKRALRKYRTLAMQRARQLESRWLRIGPSQIQRVSFDLEQHTSFGEIFEHIDHMRIVPFDFRSLSQLFGSTIGSIATVVPLLGIENKLSGWLDVVASILASFD